MIPATSRDGAAPTTWAATADILGVLPAIVWEADGVDHRMIFVSPRALDILGHDPSRWVDEPEFWESHVHPDDLAEATARAEAAIRTVTADELVYRFRAADGTYRWFRDALSVVALPDGGRRLAGIMLDVTQQMAAEAQRDLLATAVDQATESVVITDVDASILYVNPAFERVTGYRRHEVVGRNPRVLQSGRHTSGFYADMWQRLSAGEPWSGELVNRRKDGTLYTEEASISPVRDGSGTIRHFVAVKRDVTRELADRETRERLAALVEAAADAAFANDLTGTYLAWNDSATRIYGWTRAEALGRSVFDLVPEDEHANIREWLRRVGDGETIGPVDTYHRGRDGRTLTLSVTAAPIREASGRVSGIATIARDVSGDRRIAAERLALETQLRQSQKMDAVGRLAGGIAHDFNNLLTAILGYASVVAASLEGDVLEDQRQVLHAADRAADLTRRLLAFSRSGPLHLRPINIDRALEESYKLVGRLVPERIQFELHTGAGSSVLADATEVEQLLLNLVVNAVDAIPGPGRISVTTARVGVATIVLTVADTGHGMDPETQAHIFEPFFTTKPEGKGTGLGLATVYAIVQRAGGSISVQSVVGRGSTFTIELPAHDPDPGTDGQAAEDVAGGSEHILVVEDSAPVRELTSRLLVAAGYRVSAAADPMEVLSADLSDVDLIVSDVIMPGMSGPGDGQAARPGPPGRVRVGVHGLASPRGARGGLASRPAREAVHDPGPARRRPRGPPGTVQVARSCPAGRSAAASPAAGRERCPRSSEPQRRVIGVSTFPAGRRRPGNGSSCDPAARGEPPRDHSSV